MKLIMNSLQRDTSHLVQQGRKTSHEQHAEEDEHEKQPDQECLTQTRINTVAITRRRRQKPYRPPLEVPICRSFADVLNVFEFKQTYDWRVDRIKGVGNGD